MRGSLLAACCITAVLASGQSLPRGLDEKPVDPFAGDAKARVFIFVRNDCPIANRYAPELNRLYREFNSHGVVFWIVYSDPAETRESIEKQVGEYKLPGGVLRDPSHSLARRARASMTPEAAVFSSDGRLLYHGRIDNRFVAPGKERASPTRRDLEDAIAAVIAGRTPSEASAPAVGCYLADVK